MDNLTFRIPAPMKHDVEELTKQLDCSMGEYIRQLIGIDLSRRGVR